MYMSVYKQVLLHTWLGSGAPLSRHSEGRYVNSNWFMCISLLLTVALLDQMLVISLKGPSIYDVHTEGEGCQAQVDACGRERGSHSMRTSTQNI